MMREMLQSARHVLAEAGVTSPDTDADLLAAHVRGTSRGDLARDVMLGATMTPQQGERFEHLVRQRAARVPLQHLTGTAPFRLLDLVVGPGVFIPRPETEDVAGLAIAEAQRLVAAGEWPVVVDLCTGSGAIALAVASEVPRARVVAVELDPDALAWARRNAEATGLVGRVDLRRGDAVRADSVAVADLAGQVDVLVANPPYIPPDAEPTEPEVRDHDPALALYGGGDDGLAVPAAVVASARGLLRVGGLLVMEHADTQGAAARALAAPPGWEQTHTAADLSGRDRVLVARRAAGQ